MLNVLRLMMVLMVVACGDNECATQTSYLGHESDCYGGDGVCVAEGSDVECRPKCAVDGPACSEGEWWYTIATDIGHVCYCAPPPFVATP